MPFFLLVKEGKHSPHISRSVSLCLSLSTLSPSLSISISLPLSLSLCLSHSLFHYVSYISRFANFPFLALFKVRLRFMPWMGDGIFASTITRIHRVVSRKHKGHTTTKTSPKFLDVMVVVVNHLVQACACMPCRKGLRMTGSATWGTLGDEVFCSTGWLGPVNLETLESRLNPSKQLRGNYATNCVEGPASKKRRDRGQCSLHEKWN